MIILLLPCRPAHLKIRHNVLPAIFPTMRRSTRRPTAPGPFSTAWTSPRSRAIQYNQLRVELMQLRRLVMASTPAPPAPAANPPSPQPEKKPPFATLLPRLTLWYNLRSPYLIPPIGFGSGPPRSPRSWVGPFYLIALMNACRSLSRTRHRRPAPSLLRVRRQVVVTFCFGHEFLRWAS